MIAPLVIPRVELAVLERAACPERFQDRWATVWATTPWGGRFYDGNAPVLRSDAAREQHHERLNGLVRDWRDEDSPQRLREQLEQGGLVHTVHAAASPWYQLLSRMPDRRDPLFARWEALTWVMREHGADLDAVAYPWVSGAAVPKTAQATRWLSSEAPVTMHSLAARHARSWSPPRVPLSALGYTPTQVATLRAQPSSGLLMMSGAAGSGKTTMLASLMQQTLNPPCANPLMLAASGGKDDLVRWLLQQGADPLWASPWKRSVSAGANDDDASPWTLALPFMVAEWQGHADLAERLEASTLAAAEALHLRQNWPSTTVAMPARRRL